MPNVFLLDDILLQTVLYSIVFSNTFAATQERESKHEYRIYSVTQYKCIVHTYSLPNK